jgi:hypothetical protein
MKGYVIVTGILMCGMVSCAEDENVSSGANDRINTSLGSSMQGGWILTENENSDFHKVDLRFEDNTLFWKDSLVNNQGKYAISRMGSCEVKYLKNDAVVMKNYLMGRPSLTPGVQDVLVALWRGSRSFNRNYRNVNKQMGWELINEWESGNAQPPIPDAVYVFFPDERSVQLEYDGQDKDFLEIYTRPH